MSRRRFTVAMAAGALALSSPAPAVAAPSAAAADTVAVVTAIERVHGAGGNWRADLLPQLRRLSEWSQTRAVDGPLTGILVAGHIRLPARTEVTGDTTIVAGTVEFAGAKPVIVTHGHALTILPVTAVRTVALNAVIVMNTTGADGAAGG